MRHIRPYPGKLIAEVKGFIETVSGMARLTRIKIHYNLRVPQGRKAAAERAIEVYEQNCPVSQSVRHGINIDFDGSVTEE